MKPWNIDANSIELNDINSDDLDNMMVITQPIKDFLKADTNKKFIVAPKGFGKTYLLKVKSQLFRDNAKGYKFIPAKQLCERFIDLNITFSGEDIVKFTDIEIWKKTWKLSLYSLILTVYKSESLSPTIKEIIGNANTLCDILTTFLSNRKKINKVFDSEHIALSRAISDINEDSNVTQLAIFVDNIDEALGKYVGINRNDVSEKLWVYAQLALLLVSNDLCSRNSHIKFYLTIRSEAFNQYEGSHKMQLDGLCVFLKYDKAQIREIFIKNIRLMDKTKLSVSSSIDPIEAFLGRISIDHKFIIDNDGLPKKEDIFDFIYRHTYKRPREIVRMGEDIELLEPQSRTDDKILGPKVNEIASSLFTQLKTEIIPYFREDIFEAFCQKTNNNIIKYEDAQKISDEIRSEVDDEFDTFSYLYKLGLIGIVENEVNGNMKQKFLNVGEYTLSNIKLKIVKYYVIHPTLNEHFRHYVSFYDKFNVIGYDLPVNMDRKRMLETHVHFGLDRESLTLLLPELCNVKSLAVIAPPSENWSQLENAKTFVISLNSIQYSFKIISDQMNEEDKNMLLKGWLEKNYSILIYSRDKEIIKKCLNVAQVMSACYITENIKNVLNESLRIIPFSHEPYFYLCFREYEENKFNALKDNIDSLNKALRVSPVLVDRFQFNKEVLFDAIESVFICSITAEQYGSVICFDKKDAALKPSQVIHRIQSEAEFNFYKNRQNYLVESLYQMYRLLHHDEIAENKDSKHIIEEFVNIQIKRILNHLEKDDMDEIFPSKTKSELEADLKIFANKSKVRIQNLLDAKAIVLNDRIHHVGYNKEKKLFPLDTEVYKYLSDAQNFFSKKSQNILLDLYKILETQSLPDNKTWFISYSTLDKEYAEIIHTRLTLIGCKATIYSREIVKGSIKGFEWINVHNNDRMIFIASENSLKSDPCHRELKECFSVMRKNNDSSKLVIVSLDDYIYQINPEIDIWDEVRKQNFNFIFDRINIIDFRGFFDSDNLRELHKTLLTI